MFSKTQSHGPLACAGGRLPPPLHETIDTSIAFGLPHPRKFLKLEVPLLIAVSAVEQFRDVPEPNRIAAGPSSEPLVTSHSPFGEKSTVRILA